MRLWHKDLISVLPKKQLFGQWRECCLIAKGLSEGTLNHLLVNKVKEYDKSHFICYAGYVENEMIKRGYAPKTENFTKYFRNIDFVMAHIIPIDDLFKDWHNDRYFNQCFYNLQEKYDCGGISDEEWWLIQEKNISHVVAEYADFKKEVLSEQ